MYVSGRGRLVRRLDFKAMNEIGMEPQGSGSETSEDLLKSVAKSTRSTRSKVSRKSSKSRRSAKGKKAVKKVKNQNITTVTNATETAEEDTDSRIGDFDGEESDIVSLGSATSKVARIDQEMESLAPSAGELYNQYKCDIGDQERLEDADLPENLQDDTVYEETLAVHKKQLAATTEREKKSLRRVELDEMRDEIIVRRERGKKAEWEINMKANRRLIEHNERELQREREKLQVEQTLCEQALAKAQLKQQHTLLMGSSGQQVVPTISGTMATKSAIKRAKSATKGTAAKEQQTRDWVSVHSGSVTQERSAHDDNAMIDRLQHKAQRLIEQQQSSRKRAQERNKPPEQLPVITSRTKASIGSCPKPGIPHLRKLGLLPDKAGLTVPEPEIVVDDLEDDEDILLQDIMDNPGKNPLKVTTNFEFDNEKLEDCACNIVPNQGKLKSGKYAKSSVKVVKQETWPHNAVSRKYVKRNTFENMEFETFVAGETKTIYSMLSTSNIATNNSTVKEGLGRLRVLTLISHWLCKSKNWGLLKGLYESIIEDVETGEGPWADDYSGYETMVHNTPTSNTSTVMTTVTDRPQKKSPDIYWCKLYQQGRCEQSSPHMAVIRQDDGPVPVLHICAACWGIQKRRKEHPECDPTCPAKK